MIDTIKNVAAVVGCILSLFTLLNIICPPIRKFIVDKIHKWSNKEYYDKAIKEQNEIIERQGKAIEKEDKIIQEIRETVNKIVDNLEELSNRIFKNEADRLRSELFDCGNRCRRGIPLSGEEFRHIQDIFKKYSDELKCNGIGEDEYNFIKDYFNSAANQNKLNKKYDN